MRRCSALSYNGPQFHSRKLRVSLSVIRWILCSSSLEDSYQRGSENPIPSLGLGARHEANVRSDRQSSCRRRQGREFRSSYSPGQSACTPRVPSVALYCTGRGISRATGSSPTGFGAATCRARSVFIDIAADTGAASTRACRTALSRRARSYLRPSRSCPLSRTKPTPRRGACPFVGGQTSGLLWFLVQFDLKRHMDAAWPDRRYYSRLRPGDGPHHGHRARSL